MGMIIEQKHQSINSNGLDLNLNPYISSILCICEKEMPTSNQILNEKKNHIIGSMICDLVIDYPNFLLNRKMYVQILISTANITADYLKQ